MEKIKWKYDKQCKEWFVYETDVQENDGFLISKNAHKLYRLQINSMDSVAFFKKLSSAKTVANLLRHG